VRCHDRYACEDLLLTGERKRWRDCRPADAEPSSLKDIEGLIELGITSASEGFWINVHENVRLHA
jgi:hypothetical protein